MVSPGSAPAEVVPSLIVTELTESTDVPALTVRVILASWVVAVVAFSRYGNGVFGRGEGALCRVYRYPFLSPDRW